MKSLLNQANDLTRRRFVSRAAKTFLGVSALPASALAAGAGASKLQQLPTAKRVIYLYLSGGMSHLDTLDPKANKDVMGPTQAIKTRTPGMQLGEYLPKLAKQSEKFALIRSLTSTQGAHKQGNYFMHTSYELRSSIRHPAMGAWLLKYQDRQNPALPGNVMIGNDSQHPGAGFFESRLQPLIINNPAGGLQNSKPLTRFTEEQFDEQIDLAAKLDAGFVEKYDQKNVRAYADMYGDALQLMQSKDLAAFDITKEPEGLRERYGLNNFGQGVLLARRLAENGVRFIEVTSGGWDTHNANFVNLPDKANELDTALSALLTDLDRRGMLADTLVVLATEFGRTPEINSNEGRDHHPQAFSGLLAGGGIRGGQVFGKTNELGSAVIEDKIRVPDFNATIAYALGLPLGHVLYSPSMRPFTVVDKGQPVTQLFG
ncbi:MAG: hypothetical protein ACI8UO_002895 [Verrucomicrobiales bacterium]|jgi:hypothetical protein